MDPRDPDRDRQHIRPVVKTALWISLCAVLILNGCSRDSTSKIHVELRDSPEANRPTQAPHKLEPQLCPPGDPLGNDASSTPAGGHTVSLSWNPSTSANGPNAKEIRYCLYRTKGAPVQKNISQKPASPCINCQRVTIAPVTGTTYKDIYVENNEHYCYVAIAIQTGTITPSDFSNQADAVIPPKQEPPFCTLPYKTKQPHGTNRRGGR